jgi:peptide/nickel transport system permease protein
VNSTTARDPRSRAEMTRPRGGPAGQSLARGGPRRSRSRRLSLAPVIGLSILLALLLVALLADALALHEPNLVDVGNRLKPPVWQTGASPGFLLGTDAVGRDILSRIMYGARLSLLVGVLATLFSAVLGLVLGLVAGYRGGLLGDAIMRIAEIQLAFPFILLAITILVVLGAGVANLILVLSIAGWVVYARVVRAQTLSWREKEFVEAARCLGANDLRIVARHILPNIAAPLIILASFSVATNVLLEASLSFLGLGVPPSVPSWGAMLADARAYLRDAWWLATFPGLALMLTVLATNIVGDWLRDYLDPRLRV